MLNFIYEDGFKIKNKYFPAISMLLYLSSKTIRRPPQSHETIPLINLTYNIHAISQFKTIYSTGLYCVDFLCEEEQTGIFHSKDDG
jgi:hypothetical protein